MPQIDPASPEGVVQLGFHARDASQVVSVHDDDQPSPPFEIGNPRRVAVAPLCMRGVAVVLKSDAQIRPGEVEPVQPDCP